MTQFLDFSAANHVTGQVSLELQFTVYDGSLGKCAILAIKKGTETHRKRMVRQGQSILNEVIDSR